MNPCVPRLAPEAATPQGQQASCADGHGLLAGESAQAEEVQDGGDGEAVIDVVEGLREVVGSPGLVGVINDAADSGGQD